MPPAVYRWRHFYIESIMSFEFFIVALLTGLIILSALVAVHDYRFRRIPNRYLFWATTYAMCVYVSMLFFLPFNIVLKGFLYSLLGTLTAGLFFYMPYKLKQVGAGDVKLVMVFGLFLGFKGVILAILLGAMVGGVWALTLAWHHGGLSHLWYNMKFMARSMYLSGFKEMNWDLRSEGAIAMPYGVALSAGAIMIATEQLLMHIQRIS